MFADIDTETTNRLIEAKWYLDNTIESHASAQEIFRDKLYKGNFFVNIYGAFEYTIYALVSRVIDRINAEHNINVTDFKPCMLSMLLHDECNALHQVSNKKWEKRLQLFNKIKEEEKNAINNTIVPAQSGNLKYPQIEQICNVLGVEFPIIPDMSLKSRLSSVADNRNAIAHGRKTACEVGGQYTKTQLNDYYLAIENYCLYLNQQFFQYVENKQYLKIEDR
ncbi:MAG: hypothetical protein K2K84_02785 [Muribaculaceae bacterium]|nr:hypothetical protein [Muribaculaceae bacterium]